MSRNQFKYARIHPAFRAVHAIRNGLAQLFFSDLSYLLSEYGHEPSKILGLRASVYDTADCLPQEVPLRGRLPLRLRSFAVKKWAVSSILEPERAF